MALDLEREDTVVLTPRNVLTNFVKGVPLQAMLNHQHANGNGIWSGIQLSAVSVLTPASPAVSAQLGFATGAALANKLARNRRSRWHLSKAMLRRLKDAERRLSLPPRKSCPILYVIDGQAKRERRETFMTIEIGELFPVITVDAHDVVAVYRVAQESIARVREGGGPALIACMAYSLNGAPVNAVASMERYLTGKKLFSDRWKREVIAEFKREMDGACLPQADPCGNSPIAMALSAMWQLPFLKENVTFEAIRPRCTSS